MLFNRWHLVGLAGLVLILLAIWWELAPLRTHSFLGALVSFLPLAAILLLLLRVWLLWGKRHQ